jgi:osmotically-inducible protein OsmY
MKKFLATAAATVALALAIAACTPTTQSSEREGAYAGDSKVTRNVEQALWQDPALRIMPIRVSTYQNVVQLSGSVDRAQMIALASRVAGGASDGASVQNALIVN